MAPLPVEAPVELVPPVPGVRVSFEPQARKSDVRRADPRRKRGVELWFMESFFYVTERRKSRRPTWPEGVKNIWKMASAYSLSRQSTVDPRQELKST
jgi:hypothetical protein